MALVLPREEEVEKIFFKGFFLQMTAVKDFLILLRPFR